MAGPSGSAFLFSAKVIPPVMDTQVPPVLNPPEPPSVKDSVPQIFLARLAVGPVGAENRQAES